MVNRQNLTLWENNHEAAPAAMLLILALAMLPARRRRPLRKRRRAAARRRLCAGWRTGQAGARRPTHCGHRQRCPAASRPWARCSSIQRDKRRTALPETAEQRSGRDLQSQLPQRPRRVLEMVATLSGDPAVAFAEPNHHLSDAALATPDGALYAMQWHLNNTGQTGGRAAPTCAMPMRGR